MNWLKVGLLSAAVVLSGFFIGNMHKTGKKYDRYVQVKGLSEKEVEATLAVWPMNIMLTGNDLSSIRGNIEKQRETVISFFHGQGFTDREITEGMVNITDVRANVYDASWQNKPYRYMATFELTIRTGDIEKLQLAQTESLEMLSEGILLGSKNEWRPVEYIYTGLNDLKPSMIEEATKNAREVAEKFARDSNSEVGEIRVARQGLFTINDRDVNTPQVKIVRVVSTIDFQLKD